MGDIVQPLFLLEGVNIMWLDDYVLVDCTHIKRKKKFAKQENDRRYLVEFMEKLDVACSRYRLKNLPDTVSERLVLQSFVIYGNCVFFKDPAFGDNVFALPGVPYGGFNINGDSTRSYVYSKNGLINKEVELFISGSDDAKILKKSSVSTFNSNKPMGVMVWENKERFPFIHTVDYFASAISDTYRTIDVAKAYMKRPFIPICQESMVESIKQIFNQIIENEEVIPISTGVKEVDKIDFHDIIGMGDCVKDAMELLDWYEQKFREKCAITSNTQVDKKGENLISDEINMNEEYISMRDDTILEYLQKQFDFVNECLGTNISVEVANPQSRKGDNYEPNNNDNRNDA